MNIQIGDVVRLNSGSPELTVIRGSSVHEGWFVVNWIGFESDPRELHAPEACFTFIRRKED